MYLIEYKLPLLSLMYLVKIAQIKTLIFLFWDKDLDKKKIQHLVLHWVKTLGGWHSIFVELLCHPILIVCMLSCFGML